MTTLRTAAQQALEALEQDNPAGRTATITALRAALAEADEPVQEPAFHGFMSADGTRVDLCFTPNSPRSDGGTYATAYYTATPQRKPLHLAEIERLYIKAKTPVAFARAVERAHGIGGER